MRRALVDSSLMARRSARRFVGLLAEIHSVVMVSTDDTEEEMPRAVRNILRSRTSNRPLSQRADEALQEFQQWREAYAQAGLWQHCRTPDILTDHRVLALGRMWAKAPTDPDDLHLAQGVIFHDLDALLSANLTMVQPLDWDRMMQTLAPARNPKLCQNEGIIDWLANQKDASRNAELMIRSMLSILPEGYAAESRARGWAAALQDTFPHMVAAAKNYFQNTTGPELRRVHRQALEAFQAPVTRQTMETPTPEHKPY